MDRLKQLIPRREPKANAPTAPVVENFPSSINSFQHRRFYRGNIYNENDFEQSSHVHYAQAVAASAAAAENETPEEEMERLKLDYDDLYRIFERYVKWGKYKRRPAEREELEEFHDHLRELFESYDAKYYSIIQKLNKAAMTIIEEKNDIPKEISHLSYDELEEIRERPWYQIVEDFEEEDKELEKWMEQVMEANLERKRAPYKPDYYATNLFMSAAIRCDIPFKEAKSAIKQYAKLSGAKIWPELGDVSQPQKTIS